MADARGSGIRVGRFLGIPIYADVSLFITGALVAIGFLPRLEDSDPTIGGRKYLVAIGFAILLYLSILVHELAHAAVARSVRPACANARAHSHGRSSYSSR